MYLLTVVYEGQQENTTEEVSYLNFNRDQLLFDAGRMVAESDAILALDVSDEETGVISFHFDVDNDYFEF